MNSRHKPLPLYERAAGVAFVRRSRRARCLLRLMLVLCSLLVGVLLFEVGLRLAGFSYMVFDMPDAERGMALRPGASGWWRKEGEAYVRINSAGLRDREHTLAKPPGAFRIAILGDSYAEALQVPMEDTFWSILERRLKSCRALGEREVEVINFGVSGYGTAQELITLRRQVWSYAPDLILLAFTTGNDVQDNSPALSVDRRRPFFVYRDDRLVPDTSALDKRNKSLRFRGQQSAAGRALFWLRQHVRVLQLVDKARTALEQYRLREEEPLPPAPAATPVSGTSQARAHRPQVFPKFYREPADAEWKEAWSVTEGLLKLMRDEVQTHGAKFFVVTLSNEAQVAPNTEWLERDLQSGGLTDLFYPERRLKALGEREGFPVLNLAPALQAYAEQNGIYLHGFGKRLGYGHWNRAGHAAAGELTARWLCEQLS